MYVQGYICSRNFGSRQSIGALTTSIHIFSYPRPKALVLKEKSCFSQNATFRSAKPLLELLFGRNQNSGQHLTIQTLGNIQSRPKFRAILTCQRASYYSVSVKISGTCHLLKCGLVFRGNRNSGYRLPVKMRIPIQSESKFWPTDNCRNAMYRVYHN